MDNNDFKNEFDKIMDTTETTGEYDTQDIQDNKIWAILACFGITFWLPLVVKPNSRFGRFWANQGLILLICDIVMGFLGAILGLIPAIGGLLNGLADLILLILTIIGIVYAAQGKAKEIPLIGGLFKAIK